MPFYKCFPCLKFQSDEVITKLDFSNTALTDVFPDVWQHERTLEELILTSTRINALPPQLFYCQGLRTLAVNNNGLESLPNAVGSLRQLQHLNLGRNLISNVPENIKTCKNLTHLDLSCNNLQRLPDAVTCLISLQELLLNETYLEFLPANFGRLVNLHILELRLNNLITLPKSMARLSQLQRIDIGGNEFTELPEVIGELKNLRELWIDFNQIRRISPNIANLRELRHFEANGNLIETLPNEISHWRNIEVFSVCNNNLESLPFSIGMMKSLVTFKCESNQLRELPDSICNLEHLEELVLSHNQLLRLPTTIGMLRKLRYLFVDGNDLRAIPDEICNCGNLSVLSVSRNKIGELPQNIGHLSKLKVLNLVSNFIATLPVSMLSLVNLTSLWLSDNQSQPLVPLQYLDTNTKTQLTCFMLPQAGLRLQQQQQYLENEYNNDNSMFLIQQQQQNVNQQQQQQLYEFQSQKFGTDMQVCASPSRRICFAEEATIMTSTSQSAHQQPAPKVVSNDASTQSMLGEPLATRLMRSPTPYPKELRLMAKYVRNSQKVLTQKSPESINVKEAARVLSNSYCDTTINSNTSKHIEAEPHSSSQLTNATNTEQQQQMIHSGSIRSVNSYDQTIAINNNAFNPIQQQQQPLQQQQVAIHCAIPQIISYNPSLQHENPMQQYFTAYCPPTNLANSLYDDAAVQHAYYIEQQQQPHLYPQQYAVATNYDVQALVFQQQQQQQQRANNLMEPPPYHIARVFTKKSPEDLTNYDTLRNQQQLLYADDAFQISDALYFQQQHQEANSEREIINVNDATLMNLTNIHMQETKIDEVDTASIELNNSNSNFVHNAINDNALESRNFDHQNNLAGQNNTAAALETLPPLIVNNSTEKLYNSNETISGQTTTTAGATAANAAVGNRKDVSCQLQNGILTSVEQLQLMENNHATLTKTNPNGNINSNRSYQNSNNSKSKTTWLFGVHKNPTVKQVTLRWEQTVGFEIEQRKNQEGIFVAATMPNTMAATLLYAHDKLLEVDGYDFTNISFAEAQQILAVANPVLNIMLSRK